MKPVPVKTLSRNPGMPRPSGPRRPCPGDYTEAQALAADCWPAREVAQNVNTAELGDLGLPPEEEEAIVAFLKTLSDGFMP